MCCAYEARGRRTDEEHAYYYYSRVEYVCCFKLIKFFV